MNTKGLVELVVLNIGKDRGVLNDQTFAILVLMALFTTFITTPIVLAMYKPRKARSANRHRSIHRKDTSTELRLLTCFHCTGNIPSLSNIIEASRGVGKRGLRVYAMHLMKLSERSSAILMVRKARKNGLPFWNKGENSHPNQVVVAFEAFSQLNQVFIRPTTAISSLETKHEDICASAARKEVAMIILPFHKHQRVDGHLDVTRTEFRHVNRRVLQHSPCSVGILVDRGLGGTSQAAASNMEYTITALFFGGHDDREALTYGARISEHPGISLVAVRFFVHPEVDEGIVSLNVDDPSSPEARSGDEEFLADFIETTKTVGSITFEEKVAKNPAETIGAINSYSKCNLFLVGRMPEGQLVAALDNDTDCPELGPIGSLLTAPYFGTSASVLVVQQYRQELSPISLESLRGGEASTRESNSNS